MGMYPRHVFYTLIIGAFLVSLFSFASEANAVGTCSIVLKTTKQSCFQYKKVDLCSGGGGTCDWNDCYVKGQASCTNPWPPTQDSFPDTADEYSCTCFTAYTPTPTPTKTPTTTPSKTPTPGPGSTPTPTTAPTPTPTTVPTTPPPPNPPPLVNLKLNGVRPTLTVAYGTSVTLSWAIANASSCALSGTYSANPYPSPPTNGSATGTATINATYKITCYNSIGLPASDTVYLVVTQPTLTASLTATPSSGVEPLSVVLQATAGGTATGTINYSFWYKCASTSTSVQDLNKNISAGGCGVLPTTCGSSNTYGYKCDNVSDNPKATPANSYAPSGTHTGKVIIERGSVSPAESRTTISVAANSPPNISPLTVTEPDYCVSGPSALLSWTYSDPNDVPKGTDPQSAYRIQIDTRPVFGPPFPVETKDEKNPNDSNSYLISGLAWNKTYYARVRTWDSHNAGGSFPGLPNKSFTTPLHAKPNISFTWTPTGNPPAKKPVQFTDQTIFDPIATNKSWSWNFHCTVPTQCDTTTSTTQNPSVTFKEKGSYNVRLFVTDDTGSPVCSSMKPIIIGAPRFPIWKEVGPR